MILQALNDLYERLKQDPGYQLPRPRWSLQKLSFRVVLTKAGDFHDIQEITDIRDHRKKRPQPGQRFVLGGTKKSGSGLNPGFLWDNARYMLGLVPEDKDPERVASEFGAFRRRHLDAEGQIGSPAFAAVCRFLRSWTPDRMREYLDGAGEGVREALGTHFGVFQIAGETSFVHEDPAVVRWWDEQPEGTNDVPTGQCLVTGEVGPIARLHEPKIRGVIGAQGAGATLVGFNDNAYESYGKSQSFNAPVSESVAFRYTTALNAVLDGPRAPKHRIRIGDTTAVFWTDRPCDAEDIFAAFAGERSGNPRPREAQDKGLRQRLEFFLLALRKGREAYGDLADDP